MDDKDTVTDLGIFSCCDIHQTWCFAWKGHMLQLDTLSNSVAHMHAETRHVKMCAHAVMQDTHTSIQSQKGLLSSLLGDKNANPWRFKMD